MNGIGALIKETLTEHLVPLPFLPHENSEEVAVYDQPRSRLSPDVESAVTLILDFQANTYLLFVSHPVYGMFMTTAQTNT